MDIWVPLRYFASIGLHDAPRANQKIPLEQLVPPMVQVNPIPSKMVLVLVDVAVGDNQPCP